MKENTQVLPHKKFVIIFFFELKLQLNFFEYIYILRILILLWKYATFRKVCSGSQIQ